MQNSSALIVRSGHQVYNAIFYLQREKDEAVGELDAIKDRFEIQQATQNRVNEEKEMMGKEIDRLLEKYDRYPP